MNIVLLDAGTIGEDICWPDFAKLGRFTRFENTNPVEVAGRIKDAEIVLTNKVVITAEAIATAPSLKYIGTLATGYNQVDIKAAKTRGIPVCNVPDYSSQSVAQHVFALILELTNHVSLHNRSVQQGKWAESKFFCFWERPIFDLAGKTIGLVGFGNIAKHVASLAAAFEMNILAHVPHPKPQPNLPNFEFVELDELFKRSDVISLHCPLTESNKHMVNAKMLSLSKKNLILINTARGPLIDETALATALKNGSIAGAGLDVLEVEPPHNSQLMGLENCLVTPHIAWASQEARTRLMNGVYSNLQAFITGSPTNIVNA